MPNLAFLASSFKQVATAMALAGLTSTAAAQPAEPPNIVLILSDDQGWGETSYNGHPTLQTPNIDALAAAGMTLTRFYAAAPVCSPTRASLLTGRSNDRTGVLSHGYRLRHQETTLAQVLSAAGYATGHFGKWHLNGMVGPGVPLLAEDPYGPGAAGFDTWVAATNYYDDDPMLSRDGVFATLDGDSSEATMREAIAFMQRAADQGQRFFANIWLSAPHLPWTSVHNDHPSLAGLPEDMRNHHGEIIGLDRSVGALRAFLREAGLADNTLVWFQSDNGGLAKAGEAATGGLRGHKGSLYEGGLRVPSAVEWPGRIPAGSTASVPLGSVDFTPTVSALAGVPDAAYQAPLDGVDVSDLLLDGGTGQFERGTPLFFRFRNGIVALDGDVKLLVPDLSQPDLALYDLGADPREQANLATERPDVANALHEAAMAWNTEVEASLAGADYGENANALPLPPRVWTGRSEMYGQLARALRVTLERPAPGLRTTFRQRDVLVVVSAGMGAAGLLGLAVAIVFQRWRASRPRTR